MYRAKVAAFSVGAIALCAVLPLAGCGGGSKSGGSVPSASSSPGEASKSTAKGRARLTIKWPARPTSRLIPDASNSIVVEILRGANREVFDSKIVARPDDVTVPTVVTFDSLPVDTLVLRASARPNKDGSGTAQAAGEAPLTIKPDEVTDFGNLTMGTTIETITVASVSGSTAPLSAKQLLYTATPRDHDQNLVLINPAKQQWKSSDTSLATVEEKTGLVTLVAPGKVTLTETDLESGVSGSAVLTILAPSVVTATHLPSASNSVTFEIITGGTIVAPTSTVPYATVTGGTLVAKTTVARASGQDTVSATFNTLNVGTYQIRASAYPNADGTGVAQGIGAVALTVIADNNPPASVTLATTISAVKATTATGIYTAAQGQTVQMVASATNASSATVVTLPAQFTWSSSNTAVATVDSASGLVTFVAPGSVSITVTEAESSKTGTSPTLTVAGPPAPQFNPRDTAYAASAVSGDLAMTSGDTYQFDTGAASNPTLTDTTTGQLVATGQYVQQTFGTERKTVTYAVFDFTGDINIRAGSKVTATGANSLVLLAQNNVLMDGGATLDVSANGNTPGAGGDGAKSGPGAGKAVTVRLRTEFSTWTYRSYYGGGGFGGQGGGASTSYGAVYGADFAAAPTPHLQGGSGGVSGAGGGALYLAATGTATLNNATLKARGGDGLTGGSGGGLAVFGGAGVTLTQATLDTSGGKTSTSSAFYGGGGGGRIVIGYGAGAAPDLSLVTAAGGAAYYKGGAGSIQSAPFSGF